MAKELDWETVMYVLYCCSSFSLACLYYA